MCSDTLATVSLISKSNKPELFARKVVVLAYTLTELENGKYLPNFLLSIICPKQKYNSLEQWHDAKGFRLPSGFSLIKGTREMIYAGERLDIPPGFGRYFNPRVWDSNFQIDSNHHEIVARIDGVMPAVSTALVEAREEGGVKAKHIKQVIDLGVVSGKLDGAKSQYHCIALELKEQKKAKAIDSLYLHYFSYETLKWAVSKRFRYNIPLLRPSHFSFIKKLREPLKAFYSSAGKRVTFKGALPTEQEQTLLKTTFKQLLKTSAKGNFIHHKGTHEDTIKRVIKRSKQSRRKVKRLKNLIL